MKSVTDPGAVEQLAQRLQRVQPDTPRKWGSLTPGEMLCHLGDATASVLGRAASAGVQNRPFLKWIALRAPLSWPRGLKTPPSVDPHLDGTKPGDFEADRRRAIDGLRAFAAASPAELTASHGAFGRMTPEDWHRWAYRHTDHHLRQFGL